MKTPEEVEDIARDVAQQLSSEASVKAVLYGRPQRGEPECSVDQFDLLIVRDERFQPETDSYERRVSQTLVDYHFTNFRWFTIHSRGKWIKNMKIIYAQDETLRRKIQRKINSIQS